MKRVKIAAVSLAGALLLTSFVGSGFAGCGGGSSSSSSTTAPTTPNTPDTPGTPVTPGVETNNTVIFQSLKTSNLFYYLGKDSDADPTNTIVTNALDNNYSLIVIDTEHCKHGVLMQVHLLEHMGILMKMRLMNCG